MKDKSLKKNLPYMILASSLMGVIQTSVTNPPGDSIMGIYLGGIIALIVILTGVSLLLVRIVKWISKNKKWDKNATLWVWGVQITL